MEYPVAVQVNTPDRIANWRPLVQWLLALPHFLIANVLNSVGAVVWLISWFAILFTGKLPPGLAHVQAMNLRYSLRTSAYALFLTDQYPPFAFDTTSDDPGGYPAWISISPALTGRNRLTVFFRIILLIPFLVFSVLIFIIAMICGILGFFAVLFTGRWPEALRRWVVTYLVVDNRLSVYAGLLSDRYPPFTTE